MKRIGLFSILLCSLLSGDTNIVLDKGWQLIGFPTDINTSLFNNKNIDIVWGYDAKSQKWSGFSPDQDKKVKIGEKGYSTLSNINSHEGIWIHNNNSWTLSIPDKKVTDEPSTIKLKKGWNLISLPNDLSISPDIFKDEVIWKYENNKEWRVANTKDDIAPPIGKINSAEGVWIKCENDHEVDIPQEATKLHNFETKEDMENYIKEMILQSRIPRYNYYYYDYAMVDSGRPIVATPVVAEAKAVSDDAVYTEQTDGGSTNAISNATDTNLQEAGVQESDLIKHDGNNIFYLNRKDQTIDIRTFSNLVISNYKPINSIKLENSEYVNDLYLQNDRLTVISQRQYFYIMEKPMIESDTETIMPQPKHITESFGVDIYDVSDINNIAKLKSYDIEGNFNNSRMIGDTLYLVSQFYPQMQIEYPKIYIDKPECGNNYPDEPATAVAVVNESSSNETEESVSVVEIMPEPVIGKADMTYYYEYGYYMPRCGNIQYDYEKKKYYKYDYNNPQISNVYLTPKIKDDSTTQDLVTHQALYAPCKMDQDPTITTIAKLDTLNPTYLESQSILGYTNQMYASQNSVYVTSTSYPMYYNFCDTDSREAIFKFKLGNDFGYESRGFVKGSMLNQFSMSEKDNILRIATTSGNQWSRRGTDNSIFTLESNNGLLTKVGELRGLGHEGESIKSVRFVGDRGFVVTFRQTDPFYTIDLSDATNPKKVGELKIPGFSSYLHPIDENRILSIGRSENREFMIQLFDISDFSNPTLADKMLFGSGLYTEAEYNHRAFVYRASDNLFGFNYYDGIRGTMNFDILQVNNLQIDKKDSVELRTTGYRDGARSIIFDNNTDTLGVLFLGDSAISKIVSK
jgi:uncharacterized secreted protein with C-terminal beta-propeller domain